MMMSENDNDSDIDDDNDNDDDVDDLDLAHPHSGSSSTTPCQIEIWKCWFLRRGENWNVHRITVFLEKGQRERTNSKPNVHVALAPGFERWPHILWEMSAFAIMPPLLPVINLVFVCVIQGKRKPFHADLRNQCLGFSVNQQNVNRGRFLNCTSFLQARFKHVIGHEKSHEKSWNLRELKNI